jgi:osmotically-inducible protein OsmY
LQTNARIENEVRAAIAGDTRIKHPELIAVSVDEIGTVVLHGAVAHLPQRAAAIDDAVQIAGVFEVIADDLKVHPPFGERLSDDEIQAAALQRVIDDSRIRSNHIQVKVLRGRVTLTGYVRHEAERHAAVEDVTGLSGVVEVDDRIHLT